jgi:phosphatidylglycerol:prolipoprotein diacylglycerol transferase
VYPVLLKIGPLTLHTYGFLLAVGCLAGMAVAFKEAQRKGLDPEKVLDLCFYCLVFGIIFARLFFVAFNWAEFSRDPLEILRLWRGGLVFYGGFLGAALVYFRFVRKHGMPVWKTADLFALGVPLGHFFGRLGCFSAGCCYGRVCDLPWAVTFPDNGGLAPFGNPLHPTQLYEAAGNLILFSFLYFYLRKRTSFDGMLFCAYLFLYASMRFGIEFLRGDDRGSYFLGIISPSQTVAAGAVLAALVLFAVLRKRARTNP